MPSSASRQMPSGLSPSIAACLARPASLSGSAGLLGCFAGFALPIYTVLDWPLITGGKPLISIPPFVVIAFELTILFSAIAGVIGFLGLSGLPRFGPARVSDPRFSNDRFGVAVTCDGAKEDRVTTCLEQAGAEEVSANGAK